MIGKHEERKEKEKMGYNQRETNMFTGKVKPLTCTHTPRVKHEQIQVYLDDDIKGLLLHFLYSLSFLLAYFVSFLLLFFSALLLE